MTIFNQSKITNKTVSEDSIEFIEHPWSVRKNVQCLEDNLDSTHCILLQVHILMEHVVISFSLYQNRVENGTNQRSLPVKSIQKFQTLNIWKMILDLSFVFWFLGFFTPSFVFSTYAPGYSFAILNKICQFSSSIILMAGHLMFFQITHKGFNTKAA